LGPKKLHHNREENAVAGKEKNHGTPYERICDKEKGGLGERKTSHYSRKRGTLMKKEQGKRRAAKRKKSVKTRERVVGGGKWGGVGNYHTRLRG